MAGLFYLFGPNILWPQLVIAVFGALTAPATYWLGRVVANQRVGLIAALFAVTSPMLAVVSSHLGWSNSLTPFFSTLTLFVLYVGLTERRLIVVALGGLLAGLTLRRIRSQW